MEIKNRQQFLVALTIAAAALFVGMNFIYTPLAGGGPAARRRSRICGDVSMTGNVDPPRSGRTKPLGGHGDECAAGEPFPGRTQLLRSFDGWARDSGTEITGIMPQWKNDATNYMTLDCGVEATGDLGMLSRFLYSIENSPTALRVDSVELGGMTTPDNNSPWASKLTAWPFLRSPGQELHLPHRLRKIH